MIPDFTAVEIATIRELLTQRYQRDVEIHLAYSEVVLSSDHPVPEQCPAVFWHEQEANFVVVKTGMFSYRTQFFYTPHEQYGTGISEYNDLEQCVATVFQTQADHERDHQGVSSGGTGEDLNQETN
jgi:hypothetical protein